LTHIKRVLIANRGEIALRIIEACRKANIETVVAASSADLKSLPARLADRVVCIGPPSATDSYLKQSAVITAAIMTGCDAIHPGYGFLAERPYFAEACEEAGLIFIGPSPNILRLFGDKVAARGAAERASVPLSMGSRELESVDDAVAVAEGLGFPVLLKPVRGGGGKGMRVAANSEDVREAYSIAGQEGSAAFGDSGLYMEKWITKARHVEVQVAGDSHGNVVHFGDRDCSVQRRQQKLIEEAPAPGLPPALQAAIRESAVSLCRSVGYDNVGTVEFLVDVETEEYWFLEVNPRIQVEHGVTELVTGADLVALQILLASGEKMPWRQEDVKISGTAIECRVNAEDPNNDFRPSPGRIANWSPPKLHGVRIDSHCETGYLVPPFYDSLIAKIMAYADDRDSAIALLDEALQEFECEGIFTTSELGQWVLRHDDFRELKQHTKWLDMTLEPSLKTSKVT
jgi:acetyl-CoA carboxylase biotin carboxylase subunit